MLKESIPVLAGEIVDATFMSARALDAFLAEQLAAAKAQGVLFSIHLKATMMKVSDPILFGHAVKTYFADVFAKYGDTFDRIGVNPNDGLADVLTRVAALPDAERAAIEGAISVAPAGRVRRWRWSTPTAASPTCTCRATSSSTPRCRR